jgi:hypothetical protein
MYPPAPLTDNGVKLRKEGINKGKEENNEKTKSRKELEEK